MQENKQFNLLIEGVKMKRLNCKTLMMSLSLLLPLGNMSQASQVEGNDSQVEESLENACGCGGSRPNAQPRPRPNNPQSQKPITKDQEQDQVEEDKDRSLSEELDKAINHIRYFMQNLSEKESQELDALKSKLQDIEDKTEEYLEKVYAEHADLISKYTELFKTTKDKCLLEIASVCNQ